MFKKCVLSAVAVLLMSSVVLANFDPCKQNKYDKKDCSYQKQCYVQKSKCDKNYDNNNKDKKYEPSKSYKSCPSKPCDPCPKKSHKGWDFYERCKSFYRK